MKNYLYMNIEILLEHICFYNLCINSLNVAINDNNDIFFRRKG